MTNIAIDSKPTAVSLVVSTPELVGLIMAHSAKRCLYKLRLVSRLFAQACHPYFSILLIHPNNSASHWGQRSLSDAPGHLIQFVRVAQHDAKDCSIIQSSFTALEHLHQLPHHRVSYGCIFTYEPRPTFQHWVRIERRFNQLTITVMTDECQDWDP